jgi:fatty-acyl-CoA synthase
VQHSAVDSQSRSCDVISGGVVGKEKYSVGNIAVLAQALHRDHPIPEHVQLRGDQNVSVADLTKFLGPRLARYKHPKDLVLVDHLFRNAAGKVLKTVLREKFDS